MSKLNVIYWSGTGNTEQMAEYIKEGAESAGAEVKVTSVTSASTSDLDEAILALGSPSMGAEEVEAELDDFIMENKEKLAGKKVGLFGSYDWGNGEWMEEWKATIEGLGATVIGDGCILQLKPEGDDVDKCKQYGKAIIEG